MSLRFSDFQNQGFLQEIADIFGVGEKAGVLLERFGFPEGAVPTHPESSASFWRVICKEISRGKTLRDLSYLIEIASDMYPGNKRFQSFGSQKNETRNKAVTIVIPAVQNVGEILDVALRHSRHMDIGPLETKYSTEDCLSINVTRTDMDSARSLAQAVGKALNKAEAARSGKRTYARIIMEGFDQRRLELVDVPLAPSIPRKRKTSHGGSNGELWSNDMNQNFSNPKPRA